MLSGFVQGPFLPGVSEGAGPLGAPAPLTSLFPSPQMFPLPVANGKSRPTSLTGAQFGGPGRPHSRGAVSWQEKLGGRVGAGCSAGAVGVLDTGSWTGY